MNTPAIQHTASGKPYVEDSRKRPRDEDAGHLGRLCGQVERAETSRQKLDLYIGMTQAERHHVAAFEMERLGAKRLTRFAPPGMFPPTVYGAEAEDAYEQALADDEADSAAPFVPIPRAPPTEPSHADHQKTQG